MTTEVSVHGMKLGAKKCFDICHLSLLRITVNTNSPPKECFVSKYCFKPFHCHSHKFGAARPNATQARIPNSVLSSTFYKNPEQYSNKLYTHTFYMVYLTVNE